LPVTLIFFVLFICLYRQSIIHLQIKGERLLGLSCTLSPLQFWSPPLHHAAP
jgi:hypothetical protein